MTAIYSSERLVTSTSWLMESPFGNSLFAAGGEELVIGSPGIILQPDRPVVARGISVDYVIAATTGKNVLVAIIDRDAIMQEKTIQILRAMPNVQIAILGGQPSAPPLRDYSREVRGKIEQQMLPVMPQMHRVEPSEVGVHDFAFLITEKMPGKLLVTTRLTSG